MVRICSTICSLAMCFFFFSSRRRHTRLQGDWSSDVCSSDLQWPGNVRQLRNEVQRAVAMASPGGLVTPDLLSSALAPSALPSDSSIRSRFRRSSLAAAVAKLEREMIDSALEQASGNVSESARLLGLTR